MSDRTYLPGRLAEHEPGGNLRVPRTFRVELTLILLLACSGREPLPQPNSAEVHRTLIRRFYQDVWSTGNLALRDTFLAANYLGHIAGDSVALDREGWSRRLGALRKAFPDAQFTVEDVFSEGNRVAARLTMLGTHRDTLDGLPGTGRPVRVSGMSIIHLQDGRIAESWEENDALGRSQEIRAVPKVAPPSTDQADSKSDFLPPISHSKDVPARVREALFKRGCRIAEWRAKTVADNVAECDQFISDGELALLPGGSYSLEFSGPRDCSRGGGQPSTLGRLYSGSRSGTNAIAYEAEIQGSTTLHFTGTANPLEAFVTVPPIPPQTGPDLTLQFAIVP